MTAFTSKATRALSRVRRVSETQQKLGNELFLLRHAPVYLSYLSLME